MVTNSMFKLDISGPKGNAFVILGNAKDIMKKMAFSEDNQDKAMSRMIASDYNSLLREFVKLTGVQLVSPHELDSVDPELYTIDEEL